MNIAAGNSAQKQHWQNVKKHGSMTACHRRMSFSGNDNEDFKRIMEKYPEICCSKCINLFKNYSV